MTVRTLAISTLMCLLPGTASAAEPICETALAQRLLNPPRTYREEPDAERFIGMSKLEFIAYVLEVRKMPAQFRARRDPPRDEVAFRLDVQQVDGLYVWTNFNVVIPFVEEKIKYDARTGEVGRGHHGATVLRPLGVHFGFDAWATPNLTRHHFYHLHDRIVPVLRTTVAEINEGARKKFGREVLTPIEQTYPGEYETHVAPGITAEELGFAIGALAPAPPQT